MGYPGQNFEHCLQQQLSPDTSEGLHQVLFSVYRTLESSKLENSKQHCDLLKHTQGIITLVTVTVGMGEDASVWLHKENNRSKVHELQQMGHAFNRDHRYVSHDELSTGLHKAL